MEGRPLQGHRGSPDTGQDRPGAEPLGWGSHHDQASWGLLGSTSLPSPPLSSPSVSNTPGPHLAPHSCWAGLTSWSSALPSPQALALPGFPEWFGFLVGSPFPSAPQGIREVGRKHPQNSQARRSWVSRGRGGAERTATARGLVGTWRQHAQKLSLAGACGAADKTVRREGRVQTQCHRRDGHWPHGQQAPSLTHCGGQPGTVQIHPRAHGPGLGSHTGLLRPKVPPTGQPPKDRPGDPSRTAGLVSPNQGLSCNFPRSWASARLSQDS